MGNRRTPAIGAIGRIGGLEVVCQIGAGGMAEVYLARARSPEPRLVVIKTLPRALSDDSDRRTMFVDEMRIARLLRHQNIVELIEAEIVDMQPYLVLELIDGPSIRDLAAECRLRREPMDVRLAASLVAAACNGLHYAHELKSEWGAPLRLVHRDVSPQNLMVNRKGVVKVLDFGVARAVGQSHDTATRGIKGKIAYTAPEYIRGATPDRRADIFALGIVLWDLTANRRLFHAGSALDLMSAVLNDPIDPPSAHNPAVPPKLDRAILTALARDQESRWVSARSMHDAIVRAIRPIGGLMSPREIRELLGWELQELFDPALELRPDLDDDELRAIAAKRVRPGAPQRQHDDASLESMPVDLKLVDSFDGSTDIDIAPPVMDEKEPHRGA